MAKYSEAEAYWDKAGDVSYASAMFASSMVERHVNQRLWQIGVEIGKELGLTKNSHVLDLGCGDGALTNLVLSRHYKSIDGYDLSQPAIERAKKFAAHDQIKFEACDITKLDYSKMPRYDGAYLWGILHHVKEATPSILQGLRQITDNIVILEPNGNNLMRKLLEQTATYKAAGEDSFRTADMEAIFKSAGFQPIVWKRVNLFPNFTPAMLFKLLKPVEHFVENTPVLRALCTVNMWGFKKIS